MKYINLNYVYYFLTYSIGVKEEDLAQGVAKPVGVVTKAKVKEVQNQGWASKEDKHHSISEYRNMGLKTSKSFSFIVCNIKGIEGDQISVAVVHSLLTSGLSC